MPARTQRYAESIRSRYRMLTIAAWIAAAVSAGFGTLQLVLGGQTRLLGVINLAVAVVFTLIPLLYRFGELLAPLSFFLFAYLSVGFMCFSIGTGSGLQLYLLVAASLVVLLLGWTASCWRPGSSPSAWWGSSCWNWWCPRTAGWDRRGC